MESRKFQKTKETLSQFILLIRFVGISRDKVRPCKAIIPYQIYEELDGFYYKGTTSKSTALPPRAGKLKPTVIDSKLATIIVNWIDKNDSAVYSSNNNYKFYLIYMKSRDGSDITKFNMLCNRQGPFIVLVSSVKQIYEVIIQLDMHQEMVNGCLLQAVLSLLLK